MSIKHADGAVLGRAGGIAVDGARPQNLAAYGSPDVFQLAAAYASGIVHNHPFVDGNKRAGFMAAFIFLSRNGWDFSASEVEATRTMPRLAAGETSEEQLAVWLGENCRQPSAVEAVTRTAARSSLRRLSQRSSQR